MVDAIATATDDLDVIGALEPNILKFQKSLWENGLILPILTGYESTFSLVTFNDFIENNPESLVHVLNALVEPEEFGSADQEESIDIMALRLEADKAYIDSV